MTKESLTSWRYSWSQLQGFRQCQAYYRHKWLRFIEKKQRKTALVMGSAVHAFLEVWHKTGSRTGGLKAALAVFKEVDTSSYDQKGMQDFEVSIGIVEGMCEGYRQIHARDLKEYKEVMTELPVATTWDLGHRKVVYRGKIDMVWTDRDGLKWVVETKTASKQAITQGYFERLGYEGQVVSEFWLANKFCGPIEGVIYNVLVKPSIRRKYAKNETQAQFVQRVRDLYLSSETMEDYVIRHPILLSKTTVQEWEDETRDTLKQMDLKRMNKDKLWAKNTGQCLQKWGLCEFADACAKGANTDPSKYNTILYQRTSRDQDELDKIRMTKPWEMVKS